MTTLQLLEAQFVVLVLVALAFLLRQEYLRWRAGLAKSFQESNNASFTGGMFFSGLISAFLFSAYQEHQQKKQTLQEQLKETTEEGKTQFSGLLEVLKSLTAAVEKLNNR